MMSSSSRKFESDSLDILQILSLIFKNRYLVFKNSLIGFCIGFLVSFSISNKYSSQSTFVPQLSSTSSSNLSGGLSGLASLAGINLSDIKSEGSEISPILYPKIIESTPFRLELLDSKINYNSETLSVRQYLVKNKSFNFFRFIRKNIIGIPSKLIRLYGKQNSNDLMMDSDIYFITEEDDEMFEILDEIISITINEKDGFITISSFDKVKNIPAQITRNAEILLQEKVIEFKSMFSRELQIYTQEQYQIKRAELNSLQDKIAIFKDENLNINSSLFKNKLNRLESDAQILQTVVQQLAAQVEQAKLQVSKDTPVFTVIQPVSIPFEKTSPSRLILSIVFILIASFLTVIYLLSKSQIRDIYFKVFK